MMMYHTPNFWTLPIVWYSKKLEDTIFWKVYLFLSSGEGGAHTLLDPLEKANLNSWTAHVSITTGISIHEPWLCQ
jgi:hypothetical protein